VKTAGQRTTVALRSAGCLVLVLVLLVFCGSVAAAPKVVLSMSTWDTEKSGSAPAWLQMIKDIEEGTKGEFTIKIHFAEALGKAKEHYEIALKGLADISCLNVGFTPGRFPVMDLTSFAQGASGEALTKGLLAVQNKGYLDREFKGVKLLYVWSSSPSDFLWRKGVRAASSIAELKGRKIRVPTTGAANLMKGLGAIPVAIPMPEVYTSMERGVIDGAYTNINVYDAFRLSHVSNEITKVGALSFSFCLIMNQESWNKLPPDVKGLFEKNAERWGVLAGQSFDSLDKAAIDSHKPKIHVLSAADLKKIKEVIGEGTKEYIDKYQAQGYPMREAVDLYNQTMVKTYGSDAFIVPK
jgi:TRAP-type transport system periplasmic protein